MITNQITNQKELELAKSIVATKQSSISIIRANGDNETADELQAQVDATQKKIDAYYASMTGSPAVTQRIKLVKGDITTLGVDIIVNAANSDLLPGSGVCGAIYKAAGVALLKSETDALGPVETGDAVVSTSHDLINVGTKHIIHAVGPVYKGQNGGESLLLESTYAKCMDLAKSIGYKSGSPMSIAFPCISTGVYNFPKTKAANIAVNTVVGKLLLDGGVSSVCFVCFEQEDYDIYKNILNNLISIQP